MRHSNYFEVKANSHYELGLHLGALFRDYAQLSLEWSRDDPAWDDRKERARPHLRYATEHFPHLVDEVRGYANGAGLAFDDLWTIGMEDELDDDAPEKCTTLVTNQGQLIAHNEDWDADAKHGICLLKKTIGDRTILELYYLNTLGGNAISINSHGVVHAINTLSHSDHRKGVPRNVVARWLSETRDPDADLALLDDLPRSAGYHHTLVSLRGEVWSVECSARKHQISRPALPFVHTNHFLTSLARYEADDRSTASLERHQRACRLNKARLSPKKLQRVMSDTADGDHQSIFNRRTIARMLLDLPQRQVLVWMLGEEEKGWLSYPLDFLPAE